MASAGEVERDVAGAYSEAAWNVDSGRPRSQVDKLVGTRGEQHVAAKMGTVCQAELDRLKAEIELDNR